MSVILKTIAEVINSSGVCMADIGNKMLAVYTEEDGGLINVIAAVHLIGGNLHVETDPSLFIEFPYANLVSESFPLVDYTDEKVLEPLRKIIAGIS